MKKVIKNGMRRAFAICIAFAMVVTMIPVNGARAATTENNKYTQTYDGYKIEYDIVHKWDKGQTIQITVTNTGSQSLLNWAFRYDALGTIRDLWNATVIENDGTNYFIKCVNSNYEIKPGKSILFGYTLENSEAPAPEDFELCSKEVEVSDGYDIQFSITDSWDTGFNGKLIIKNTSDAPIEAWTLSFDTNFVINNLSDCNIIFILTSNKQLYKTTFIKKQIINKTITQQH